MGQHPLNLAVRFILELIALFSLGYWGWQQGDGLLRLLWAVGAPLLAALLWGIFRVPGDPGDAPVAVPGVVRLLGEGAFFAFAVWAQRSAFPAPVAWIFGVAVLVHYAISYDRILWLLGQ